MKVNYRSMAYLLFLGMFIGCSPKIEQQIPQEPVSPEIKNDVPTERLTSCMTLDDLSPAERSRTEDAYTLYRDQYKFDRYEAARELWKQAFYTAPGANGRVTYHFRDGVNIYTYLYNQAAENLKQGIADTILAIYDKQIECFPAAKITTRASKAFDSYYNIRGHIDEETMYRDFVAVIETRGKEADYFVINPFSRLLYDRILAEKTSVEEAKPLAMTLLDAVKNGLATCKGEMCESWEIINEYTPDLLAGLEGIRGFYDCAYYMDKYYAHFEADQEDCDNVSEVYYKMLWANCNAEHPQLVVLRTAKDKACYVAPPPPGPLRLAYTALESGEFRAAIRHLEDYVAVTEDPLQKADKLLTISKIYYAHIKNFPEARRYALRAAEHRSNWGEPFILIGKLYASSGPLCGPGRGWDSQIVTWPAIDKFELAKRIDPSSASEANSLIAAYTKYMPSKEDIFFRQIQAGSSFRVPCWIQENTIVRTAD